MHAGETPFSCNICKKAFSQNQNLAVHGRIHNGEKLFSCDVRGKSFREDGTLKRHRRIHTGERPFSCNVCGKSFICFHLMGVESHSKEMRLLKAIKECILKIGLLRVTFVKNHPGIVVIFKCIKGYILKKGDFNVR